MDTQVHKPAERLAQLEELSPAPGRRWSLAPERLSLGRDQMSYICVDDPTVSRHHADLLSRGDDWVIVDLASTTGTLVNGLQIHQQVLRNGDRVRVGNSELQFLSANGIAAGRPRYAAPTDRTTRS
jgi:pSer/pThr/pTyr-binding forkhead associated (FHA) protein